MSYRVRRSNLLLSLRRIGILVRNRLAVLKAALDWRSVAAISSLLLTVLLVSVLGYRWCAVALLLRRILPLLWRVLSAVL